eukprot:scaffold13249_cov118-Isochrysis_galbana.AAC.4
MGGQCCSFVVLACALLPARALGRAARDSKVHSSLGGFWRARPPPLGAGHSARRSDDNLLACICTRRAAGRDARAAGREEGVERLLSSC